MSDTGSEYAIGPDVVSEISDQGTDSWVDHVEGGSKLDRRREK